MEDLRERAIQAIVTQNPQRSGERALVLAMQHCQAEAGALFRVSDGELTLFIGRSIDQLTLDRVLGAWRKGAEALGSGKILWEQNFLVAPIGPMGKLQGLLYLAASRDLSREGAAETIQALSDLFLVTLTGDAVMDELASEVAETGRSRLLRLLDTNEWNIARVARLAGVSRVTIYSWLTKYGIERKRVPKCGVRLAPSRS